LEWASTGSASTRRDAHTADGRSNDLSMADVDAMTSETWRAFVRWYLETQGYHLLTAVVDDEAATMSFECHVPDGAGVQDVLVVTPASGAQRTGGDALLARSLAEQRKRWPGKQMVVITRLEASHVVAAYAGMPWLTLVDRARLAAHIQRQAGAFGHRQRRAESETEARANAALAVQATLRDALAEVANELASAAVAKAPVRDATAPATIESIEQQARLLRQVLLACETLAEDWAGLFGAAPTRANGLVIERDAAAIGQLGERATHLGAALRQAVGGLTTPAAKLSRAAQQWRGALDDEFAQQCRLLASKCGAIDPTQWRDFDAAHPAGAADTIAEAFATWQRASLRTRRLRDEASSAAAELAPHPAPRA
jgi:hypothetical protein